MALTANEAQIYDRQIRLWGVEAQKRMRSSRVLVAGVGALGAEVAKNITLAGVNTTVLDTVVVQAKDLGGSFLITAADVGSNRAEASLPRVRDLNPLVQTTAVTKDASQLSDEELRTFSCVVLCDAPLPTQVSVAERCHALRVPVIAATLMGFWGFFFEDVGEHSYRTEDVANTGDGEAAKPATLGSVQHKALSAAMATPWRDLSLLKVKPAAFAYMALLHGARAGEVGPSSTPAEVAAVMARHAAALCPPPAPLPPPSVQGRRSNKTVVDMSDLAGADGCSGVLHSMAAGYGRELSAVATVLGGCIGNEVVKILTGKEEPVTNLYTFDAMQGTGGYASTF